MPAVDTPVIEIAYFFHHSPLFFNQKNTKMKTVITLATAILIVLSGAFSLSFYLKDNYTVSGMLTATCIICISLCINTLRTGDMEKAENQEQGN